MADLLSSSVDPTGIMSLLAPIVSGGAIQPAPPGPSDPQAQAQASNATIPAFLAFAQRMGQAAGPHYGPGQPIGPAIADAMGAGYGTARQAQMLPILQQSAAMSMEQRELALQQQQFEFGKEREMWNAFGPSATAGISAAAPAPGTGAPGGGGALPGMIASGPPATTAQLAQLPEVQALPSSAQVQVMQVAAAQGMSLPAAAQWARQIMVESRGIQADPETGKPVTSSTGAIGIGQMMPGTFADMKKQYPDVTGDITDPLSNLRASAHYFNQGLAVGGGNLAAAAAYYNGGPTAQRSFMQNGQTGNPETDAYLVRTGALPTLPRGGGTQVAGPGAGPPGAPGGAAPGAAGGPADLGPLVQAQFNQGVVPQQVEARARLALIGAMKPGDPQAGPIAYANVINDYRKSVVTPGPVPGTQVEYGGKVDPASVGSIAPHVVTGAERAQFGNIPPDVTIMSSTDPSGQIKYDYLGGSRAVNLAYQRIDGQNDKIMSSQAWQNQQAGQQRASGVFVGLNAYNRAGDEAAIESLAKVFDPNAAVTEGKLTVAESLGGIGQQLMNWYSQAASGTGDQSQLPDVTRSDIANLAINEMKSRDVSVARMVTQARNNYTAGAPGSDPMRIFPGWQPGFLTKNDQDARWLQPDQTPALPVTTSINPKNGKTMWNMPAPPPSYAPPASPTTVPPAPTPVAPPAAPGAAPSIAGNVPLMGAPGSAPVVGPNGRPVVLPPAGGGSVIPSANAAPAVAPGGAGRAGGGAARGAPATPPAPSPQGPAQASAPALQIAAVPSFSNPGLNNLKRDIQANPGKYSPEFVSAVAAEIQKRLAAAKGG